MISREKEMEKQFPLQNGQNIKIVEKLTDYLTEQTQYIIENDSRERFTIFQQALEKLLPKTEFSKDEKIQLFLAYFQGRRDVYAKRWIGKKGKGYGPYCGNEWTSICPKKTQNNPRFDCSKCKVRKLMPYDETVVERHIQGNQREFFGIYPMIEGDKTHFIVLDFDKENALAEAQAVEASAQKYQIKLLIERSQSGKGIHLWLFFEKAIPAYLARKLGNLILLDAMSHSEINFISYDRMIPMQDTLPRNSFGNLIVLPLKWENVQEGKSTFLNAEFEQLPAALLWQHLSSIPKYKLKEVNQFIEKLENENPVQDYLKKDTEDENVHFLKEISGQKAGELIISKENLTRKEQISLMYLATFKNPEYYKRQKMRTTTWNIPRLITSAREDAEFIYLPRGLEETLRKKANSVKLTDLQTSGRELIADFKGTLYPEQEKSLRSILSADMGILSARTGFGKTIVAAKAIEQRKVSTLILVQNQNLAEQWQKQLSQFLDISSTSFVEYTKTGRIKKKPSIGIISGSKSQQTKNVDIAMIQKLSRLDNKELKLFFSDYGQIIVDECHHIAAFTFENVIRQVSSRYIMGLSATPEREDGLTPIIQMRCGNIIFESEKLSQENVLLKNYLYPRYTSIGEIDKEFEKLSYPEQLNFLARSQSRNQQIADDILANVQLGRTSLVLSERVEHLKQLQEMLPRDINAYRLTGQQSKKENTRLIAQLKTEKNPFVLLATSRFAGEGFDLPQLDTLFLTLPFKAKGNHKQYLGRLQRDLKNKDELRVYDYVDISSGLFSAMYQKRLSTYRSMNYELAEDEATRKYQARVFDTTDYKPYFLDDLQTTKSEIFVIVSVLSKTLCQKLLELKSKGITVAVNLLNSEELPEHLKAHQEEQIMSLRNAEITVMLSNRISQSIAICDGQKCWYGNLNFLSLSRQKGNSIRFDNERLAAEIQMRYVGN